MKAKISFILSLAFAVGILTVQAQNTPVQSTTPTLTPGPAWRLTPEQRAERQQFIQATVLNLQARRDNGTINANEKTGLRVRVWVNLNGKAAYEALFSG
jgi:hypothetical protein